MRVKGGSLNSCFCTRDSAAGIDNHSTDFVGPAAADSVPASDSTPETATAAEAEPHANIAGG